MDKTAGGVIRINQWSILRTHFSSHKHAESVITKHLLKIRTPYRMKQRMYLNVFVMMSSEVCLHNGWSIFKACKNFHKIPPFISRSLHYKYRFYFRKFYLITENISIDRNILLRDFFYYNLLYIFVYILCLKLITRII